MNSLSTVSILLIRLQHMTLAERNTDEAIAGAWLNSNLCVRAVFRNINLSEHPYIAASVLGISWSFHPLYLHPLRRLT
jgi:hypothetical protein